MAPARVGVVGGGILGLAVARRVTELAPDSQVSVLEKEDGLAIHQTGHNSGVAHAGIYYPPGSLKAMLCRRGVTLLKAFCEQRGLPYEECGKLVVARDSSELSRLADIEHRATANGVPGLRRLTPTEMVEVEPHVQGVAALHSPTTAIVDYGAVSRAYGSDVTAAGGTIRLGFEVGAITRHGRETRLVATRSGEALAFDEVVVCAGLHSDRLARLAGDEPDPVIIPFRGEYVRLVADRTELVRGLIYPVPDPAYPFLGVHFTRRVDGGWTSGPTPCSPSPARATAGATSR